MHKLANLITILSLNAVKIKKKLNKLKHNYKKKPVYDNMLIHSKQLNVALHILRIRFLNIFLYIHMNFKHIPGTQYSSGETLKLSWGTSFGLGVTVYTF